MSTPDLTALMDKPIAFHPAFAELTKSINAALILSQALYWSRRTKDPDGWFYKSQPDWEKETYLGRREQETARKLLRATGFWKEKRTGSPAQLYFKIDRQALNTALLRLAESANQECTEAPIENVVIRHTPRARPILPTENTTSASAQEKPRQKELPTEPPYHGAAFLVALTDFEAHRKEMRKALQPTGRKRLYEKLCVFGEKDATTALQDAVANGWVGVFRPNGHGSNGHSSNGGGAARPACMAGEKTEAEMAEFHRVGAEFQANIKRIEAARKK